MTRSGRSREHLERTLSSAFAEGLLSQRTYSHRLGLLIGPRLVDRQRIVGDLTLRRRRSSATDRLHGVWLALAESLQEALGRGVDPPLVLLLALDLAERDQLLVGRHPRCNVVLIDASVSRRHAQITFRDGVWVIQDLGSTNGTFVNGVPVGRAALYAGDVVTLGDQSIQID